MIVKNKYDTEGRVTNSSLSWFQISPRYFKDRMDNLIEEEGKEYFGKGQIYHTYLLQPEKFDEEYTFLDYTAPKSAQQKAFCENIARYRKGTKKEKLLRAYKDAYTTKESDDKVLEKAKELEKTFQNYIKYIKLSSGIKVVLPNSMLETLNNSRLKLIEHKKASELMFNKEHSLFGDTEDLFIKNELEIYWDYPEFNIPCRSTLDRIVVDHKNKEIHLVDLKTTSHISEFRDKAKEYKYHRQLAFYWMALTWYFKNELKLDPVEYQAYTYIVAVTTTNPIEARVFKIMESTINEGLQEIEDLMPRLKWHFDNDKWDHSRLYYEGDGSEIF